MLHLRAEDILSIEIRNPILPGDTFDSKEFILDVEITLNNAALINLAFTPFPECVEFCATYKLLNIKNQHLYSDKFILSVVDLTQIALATDEDKAYGIDRWSRLFKSTTWEEIKKIAENNPILTEASETLYTHNANEIVRQRSQARAEYIEHERAVTNRIAKLSEENAALIDENQALAAECQALAADF